MNPLVTGSLEVELVTLEPLSFDHVDALADAAARDRTSYGFTEVPDGTSGPRGAIAYVEGLLEAAARRETVPMVQIRRSDGVVVGATRYLNLRSVDDESIPYALEVGGTWLAADAQRTGINLEAKLLLFSHAFDVWGVRRIAVVTDARNERSARSIRSLGASFEGVLRQFQPSLVVGEEGTLRDTAVFSVVAAEWPEVRALLLRRLGRAED